MTQTKCGKCGNVIITEHKMAGRLHNAVPIAQILVNVVQCFECKSTVIITEPTNLEIQSGIFKEGDKK